MKGGRRRLRVAKPSAASPLGAIKSRVGTPTEQLVSWLVVKLTSGGGCSTGRSPVELGVVGASGSIGALGSGQTALIWSSDAEE